MNFAFVPSLFFLLLSSLFVPVTVREETPTERFSRDINHYEKSPYSECYDQKGHAQQCFPDFVNAAYNLPVAVSRPEYTCGVRLPSRYCMQVTGANKPSSPNRCSVCDSRIPIIAQIGTVFQYQSHPPALLTDFNDEKNETRWQSITMEEGLQYPNRVNLTLNLGKKFTITYVRLKFASPRPESFVIYKRTRAGDPWTPWQYYSLSCLSTFGLQEKAPILPGNEAVAQCTREFSDISPLTGGNIVFSTREGRPSVENFGESETLQEWATATEIMVSLVRMNTFGDEIFGSATSLRTYFYAISDFAVGGRCECNGHASECVRSTGGGEAQLVCDCKHNTAGVDCGQCAPFHLDRPWRPAIADNEANECLSCDCNGLSNRCYFDAKLFEKSGHGGHCIGCVGNTMGPNCELCLPNHWRHAGEHYCRPCQCNEMGSLRGQCDGELQGQCSCKPGVAGQFCDHCAAGFYELGPSGCKDCRCLLSGSFDNVPACSPLDGTCACKANVEGKRCGQCKPGYFLLSESNPFGCSPCFCFGHSSICSASDGFFANTISADILEDSGNWTALDDRRVPFPSGFRHDPIDQAIFVQQNSDRPVYFSAPTKFLGDKRLAYGQHIRFALRLRQPYAACSNKDLILVGARGRTLSIALGAQGNPRPSDRLQQFQFRLHADLRLQWSPALHEMDFIGVLSNLKEIRVRATFSRGDVGFLSNFSMVSATDEGLELDKDGIPRSHADWVERCACPPTHSGQFCQLCSPGHKRAEPFGGPLSKCVPCECNGHGKGCDPESGICDCDHHTAGDTCAQCARGYVGDALMGTPAGNCKSCECPGGGPCTLMDDGDIICTECAEGYTGRKCEYCAEEYFGEPLLGRPCHRCNCSGNVDTNVIGQCDPLSGQCTRCAYHTAGWNCERCAPGHWGDAVAEPKSNDVIMARVDQTPNRPCKPCNCYAPGTRWIGTQPQDILECSQHDGQCLCLPNVIGQRCDHCAPGFFNITAGIGCQFCECDPLGSLDGGVACDMLTGQCRCKKGVTGLKCDQCASLHFGFGATDGCAQCVCHALGAETSECDIRNGQCLCRDWVDGRQCDQCAENHHSLADGCPSCDECYELIQRRKDTLNATMGEMSQKLDELHIVPIPLNNSSFNSSLKALIVQMESLERKADEKLENLDPKMGEHFNDLGVQLNSAFSLVNKSRLISAKINSELKAVERNLSNWKQRKSEIKREIDLRIKNLNKHSTNVFRNAEKALQRFGHVPDHKLRELAAETSKWANKHSERASTMKKMASEIGQKSKQMAREAHQAVFGVNASSDELSVLHADANKTGKALKETLEMAREIGDDVEKVQRDATLILAKAAKPMVPNDTSPEKLLSSLDALKSELNKTMVELEEARMKGSEMEGKARKEMDLGKEIMRKEREKAERTKREFEKVRGQAVRADETAQNATRMVEELEEMERKLGEAKDEKQLKMIRADFDAEVKKIPKTEEKLHRLEKKLAKMEKSAKERVQNWTEKALKTALDVKEKAEISGKLLIKLGTELEQQQQKVGRLRDRFSEFEEEIRVEEEKAKQIEESQPEIEQKREETQRLSTENARSSERLRQNVDTTETLLNALLDRLNSVDPPSSEALDLLEVNLEKAENDYAKSEIEQTTKKMKKVHQQLLKEGSRLRTHLDDLKDELRRLQLVKDAIPMKCFNVVHIEQNGK